MQKFCSRFHLLASCLLLIQSLSLTHRKHIATRICACTLRVEYNVHPIVISCQQSLRDNSTCKYLHSCIKLPRPHTHHTLQIVAEKWNGEGSADSLQPHLFRTHATCSSPSSLSAPSLLPTTPLPLVLLLLRSLIMAAFQ